MRRLSRTRRHLVCAAASTPSPADLANDPRQRLVAIDVAVGQEFVVHEPRIVLAYVAAVAVSAQNGGKQNVLGRFATHLCERVDDERTVNRETSQIAAGEVRDDGNLLRQLPELSPPPVPTAPRACRVGCC